MAATGNVMEPVASEGTSADPTTSRALPSLPRWATEEDPADKPARPKKKLKTVLTRMEDAQRGPFSILYRSVTERLKVKVWTRNYKHVRGICTGYVVAFDKHFNLAMADVDEVYLNPARRLISHDTLQQMKKTRSRRHTKASTSSIQEDRASLASCQQHGEQLQVHISDRDVNSMASTNIEGTGSSGAHTGSQVSSQADLASEIISSPQLQKGCSEALLPQDTADDGSGMEELLTKLEKLKDELSHLSQDEENLEDEPTQKGRHESKSRSTDTTQHRSQEHQQNVSQKRSHPRFGSQESSQTQRCHRSKSSDRLERDITSRPRSRSRSRDWRRVSRTRLLGSRSQSPEGNHCKDVQRPRSRSGSREKEWRGRRSPDGNRYQDRRNERGPDSRSKGEQSFRSPRPDSKNTQLRDRGYSKISQLSERDCKGDLTLACSPNHGSDSEQMQTPGKDKDANSSGSAKKQPEFLERHVNQLFIRGDNVVLIALVTMT